jgi:hypothetical protein
MELSMAIVAPLGVSQTGQGTWTGEGGPGPSQVTAGPALKDYPFSDPIFQNFTAQQYVPGGIFAGGSLGGTPGDE